MILLIVACVLLLLLRYFTKKEGKKGSPWLDWNQFPTLKPLQTDRKLRDTVIAQRFKPAQISGQHWDAVIVGSGIGGLATGALLSRAGWRILVLEQHDQAGGGAHVFQDQGFEFDVGIHYVGNLGGNSEFRTLLDQLSEGQLQWAPMEEDFDHVVLGTPGLDRRVFKIRKGDWELLRSDLLGYFPQEPAAINKFINQVMAVKRDSVKHGPGKMWPLWFIGIVNALGLPKLISSWFHQSATTIQQEIERMTTNKDLRAVFSYCFGDFGVIPSKGPWVMQTLIWNHFRNGAFYPVGGPSQIAHSIIPVIRKGGGQVLCGAEVRSIRMEGGRAVGVMVAERRKGSDAAVFVPAGIVISDAGVMNTFTRLLPEPVAAKSRYSQYVESVGSGESCVMVFVGLNGSGEELGLKSRNYWLFPDNDPEAVMTVMHNRANVEEMVSAQDSPVFFACFPSAKDPSWNDRFPGKSTAIIIACCNREWFADDGRHKKRSEDYERAKKEYTHFLWDSLLQHFPQLEGRDEYLSMGTPLTTSHFLNSPNGELYGLDHSTARFTPKAHSELRAKTDVPGLWLTGQDIFMCGLVGGSYGGLLCASDLLGKNLFYDLIHLRKERQCRQTMKTE